MNYFLGGYYLIKPSPLSFGEMKDKIVLTASGCINEIVLGEWAYPWDRTPRRDSSSSFRLSKSEVDCIRRWVEEQLLSQTISWNGVFVDKQTALDCRNKFFSHIEDLTLVAIYFSESEKNEYMSDPELEEFLGIALALMNNQVELETEGERLLGFDLIGVEFGAGFHTFHCHEMANELSEKFGLSLNEFGLFDAAADWAPIIAFMNDENAEVEPVPWYVVKVKTVDTSLQVKQ